MGAEITKYDRLARYLYELHHLSGTHFNHLPRIERDEWRARAQVAYEDGTWKLDPPMRIGR